MAFRRIVAATDFTELDESVLNEAIDLASAVGAEVTVVHAYQVPVYTFPDATLIPSPEQAAEIARAAQAQLDAEVARRRDRGVALQAVLRNGSPAEVILDVAKDVGADLLVLGTHGRGALRRALLGSVALGVVRSSPIPVLTIRGPQAG